MEFTPTPEQEAIREAFRAKRGSLLVEAGAGCAKTSTLKWAVASGRDIGLALAFNRRIAEDLQGALPPAFTVKTFNSLGHQAWIRTLPPGTKITIDPNKIGKLTSELLRNSKIQTTNDQWQSLNQLVKNAMQNGILPTNDNKEDWKAIADSQSMFDEDFELLWPLPQQILANTAEYARQGIISFEDQIYCPTVLGGKWTKYPLVLVDEDQDLSPLNIKMLSASAAAGARIVAMGDKRQAIYAWRGASGEAAQEIKALRPQGAFIELPLLTTFRCPQVIVERQQSHVPGFRAAPQAPKGAVHSLLRSNWSWDTIASKAFGNTLAILCRNNAPIVSLAFRLLRQNISVQVLGRDIGKGLTAIIKKISPSADATISRVLGQLSEWESREVAKLRGEAAQEKLSAIYDKCESIRAIASATECNSQKQLIDLIERLFARDSGKVTLSSIHKAKGLEWDTVVHLDPWRIPSKFALACGGCALEQERNLLYVAETRTKHTLILASLADFYASGAPPAQAF